MAKSPVKYRNPGRCIKLGLLLRAVGSQNIHISAEHRGRFAPYPYRIKFGCETVDWDDNDVLDAIRFLQEMRRLP